MDFRLDQMVWFAHRMQSHETGFKSYHVVQQGHVVGIRLQQIHRVVGHPFGYCYSNIITYEVQLSGIHPGCRNKPWDRNQRDLFDSEAGAVDDAWRRTLKESQQFGTAVSPR